MLLHKRLRALRLAKDLQQKEVAEQLGIKPPELNRIEAGIRSPSIARLDAIAHVYQVNLTDLLCEYNDLPEVSLFRWQERLITRDQCAAIAAILGVTIEELCLTLPFPTVQSHQEVESHA